MAPNYAFHFHRALKFGMCIFENVPASGWLRPQTCCRGFAPGPHWGLPSIDPLIWPPTPPSRSAPGHGHLVNTLARQSLIANGNSLPLKVGVITFTWPIGKVFGPIRIFRMAETVRYKFGTRVFAYGRIQNWQEKRRATLSFLNFATTLYFDLWVLLLHCALASG